MKKCWMIVALLLVLSGCGAQETFETVADVQAEQVSAAVQQILLELPENAQTPVMQSDDGEKLYLCDGYTVTVQTTQAGDLDKTLRAATGYGKEELELIQTLQGDAKRYESVWTAAGEGETLVGRTCILDDGSYHYVLNVMAPEEQAGELREQIQSVFDSFWLISGDIDLNTGS